MAGFLDNIAERSFLGNLYKNLNKIGKFGMEYDDMVIRNSQAIGATESSYIGEQGAGMMLSIGLLDIRILK
jgi:hypothetical protein